MSDVLDYLTYITTSVAAFVFDHWLLILLGVVAAVILEKGLTYRERRAQQHSKN